MIMNSIKPCKTSLGGLLLLFMVKNSFMEPPPPQQQPFDEPIIYVSFTRWENRTFSPRVYYLLLQRYGLKNKLLNIPEYEISGNKNSESNSNQDIDGIANRFGFSGKTKLKRPVGTQFNKLSDYSDNGEPTEKEKNTASVHFPSDDSTGTRMPTQQGQQIGGGEFFSDRLAYPGLSNRRPLIESQVTTEASRMVVPMQELTEDDTIETIALTYDIMKVSDFQDENAVFSPLSISCVLAMLLLGANGTTYKEIANQLRRNNKLGEMNEERELRFHTAFHNLLNILDSGSSDHVSLETFSQIFIDKKFQLDPTFEQKAFQYYNARSEVFDFQTEGEVFKKKVNDWISYKTKGKIQSLVDSPPDPTTTFSLVNAVYFQGNWRSPFISGITQMKPFYVSESETIDVPMMTNILTIPYLEEEEFRVIGLPYKDNKTGMFVILPKNPGIKGLRDLEQKFNPAAMTKLFSMRLTQVTVQMPKMRVEGDGHIQEILAKLGMKTVFDGRLANFSKVSENDGLYIKSILHRAVLDVNERGTEAAAATVATGDRNLEDRPVLFAVNRPFMFSILQVKAKTVLFCGRVTRPQPLPE